ncbi:MAG: N-acetyltransferase [Deltaproteobacteria bacterium]|nr:N-acetyltransferase [Deltaproteobacteria bacterium]
MNQKVVIRDETDTDVGAITEVTVAAFKTLEISNRSEQFIIEALRAADALTLSLVAEVDGRVVGHVAFSTLSISDGTRNWYGLGPLSVLPKYQRRGIGKALTREGFSRLIDMDAQGCCLFGHPDCYRRFGVDNMPVLEHGGGLREVSFALSFYGHIPQGTVTFHDGFRTYGRQEDRNNLMAREISTGIMSREDFQRHTIAIARGEHKPGKNEPKIWFDSVGS